MNIYCCGCVTEILARLTSGKEIYPHRVDLHDLPFWKCDTCGNYVGCHHKTANGTQPLGVIPTKEIMNARKCIHALLDPLWKTRKVSRGKIYTKLSKELGYSYHTGEIKCLKEARRIYLIIKEQAKLLGLADA